MLFYRGTLIENIGPSGFLPAINRHQFSDHVQRQIVVHDHYKNGFRSGAAFCGTDDHQYGHLHTVSAAIILDLGVAGSSEIFSKIPSRLDTKTRLMIDLLISASVAVIFTIICFLPENPLIAVPVCGASVCPSFGCMYPDAYMYDSMQTTWQYPPD